MGTELERKVTRETTVTSGGEGGLTVGVVRDFLRACDEAGFGDDVKVRTFCPVVGQPHNFIQAGVIEAVAEVAPGEVAGAAAETDDFTVAKTLFGGLFCDRKRACMLGRGHDGACTRNPSSLPREGGPLKS